MASTLARIRHSVCRVDLSSGLQVEQSGCYDTFLASASPAELLIPEDQGSPFIFAPLTADPGHCTQWALLLTPTDVSKSSDVNTLTLRKSDLSLKSPPQCFCGERSGGCPGALPFPEEEADKQGLRLLLQTLSS